MKKIILTLITISSLNLFSQQDLKDFEGLWTSGDTNFITVFTHNDVENKLSVHTFSFISNSEVIETIVKANDTIVKTKTINPRNGWEVTTDYKLLTKGTMLALFEGDTNIKSLFYKGNFNTDNRNKE